MSVAIAKAALERLALEIVGSPKRVFFRYRIVAKVSSGGKTTVIFWIVFVVGMKLHDNVLDNFVEHRIVGVFLEYVRLVFFRLKDVSGDWDVGHGRPPLWPRGNSHFSLRRTAARWRRSHWFQTTLVIVIQRLAAHHTAFKIVSAHAALAIFVGGHTRMSFIKLSRLEKKSRFYAVLRFVGYRQLLNVAHD
jgi:hypothetical protein